MQTEEVQNRLQEIGDILNNKYSGYFVFHSKNTNFTTRFPVPIQLNPHRNYEIALQYFSTSNYISNIIKGENNVFKYSTDDGKNYITKSMETGAYEMKSINNDLKRLVGINPAPFDIGLNLSTFKSEINIINDSFKIDFTGENTLRDLLGFKPKIIGKGLNISDNTVQITNTSAILVHCDLVSGSFINGIESNILYSFPAYTVPVGYKINISPPNMIYLSVNRKVISNITFRITNEDMKILDFKNEDMVITCHIRQV